MCVESGVKTFLSTLTNALWVVRFPSLVCGGSAIPAPGECQILFPGVFLVVLSLALDGFCHMVHWPVLWWMLAGNPCGSLYNFCLAFCPMNFHCFGLPGLPALSPQLGENTKLCLNSTFPLWGLDTRCNWGNCRAHLNFFSSFRYHCSSLLDSQCLKTIVLCILPSNLAFSGRRGSLFSVSSSWLEAKVYP